MYAPRQAKPDKMGDGVHIRPVYGLMQSCKYVEQGTMPGMPLATVDCYGTVLLLFVISFIIIFIVVISIIIIITIIIIYCINQDPALLPSSYP
jgi:hypothetical protein